MRYVTPGVSRLPVRWPLLACALAMVMPCAARSADNAASPLHAAELRCEYLVDPLGINETAPRLSWVDDSPQRGETQSAYQVLVASQLDGLRREAGDLWDSGKVASDETTQIVYAGKPLTSRAEAYWMVRVWDRDGSPSAWSKVGKWTMGLLAPSDWRAKWIDATSSAPEPAPAITVVHAVYGTGKPDGSKDVTDLVARLLRDDPQNARADAAMMGGDPAPNQRKKLALDLTVNGEKKHLSIAEGAPIALPGSPAVPRYLRKTFTAPAAVRRATLYVTALGLYEATLNGQRVGDHVLAPDWTDYNRRVRYQSYDVTALVRPGGENVLGALLGNGWYAGHLGNGGFQQYGKVPALLAQLEITGDDGRVTSIVSDGTWTSHASPVTASDFMLGETFDARQELPGWDRPGFDAHGWGATTVREEKPRELDAQVAPPVRATGERKPVALTEPAPGRWTFDLGQNMVGIVRLKVTAPAGTVVTLHHAEVLNPDGTVYTKNLRGAPSTDIYTCKGGGEETWQPRFTFHGFRYVEVTGLPDKPAADAVTGIVLGTDNPRTGSFTCSDARINQLVSNIEWGQRGNYLSVPTDCPQRDERLGWMGDAEVFVRTATDVADVAAFFTKWLVDVDDAQTPDGAFTDVSPERGSGHGTPAWADAGVICPWTIYTAYGDKRVLQTHLPAMTRWVEWCRAHSTNLLRDNRKDRGGDFGDWLAIGANTPKDVIGTAFFAYSTHLVAKSYAAVGDAANAAKYGKLFEDVRDAFCKAYVAPDGRIQGDTQCVYAMALRFELLPEELRPKAVQYLADDIAAKSNHLSTGFVGVSYLLPTLTAGGRLDTAYALLTQDTFPSWLFSVKQGATTIWERWDGWTPDKGFQSPSMNSFNHYSLGSCGEWLYDTVAGIGLPPDGPGYKTILLHPHLGGGLTGVKAGLHTMHGQINSAWTAANGTFTYDVTVPANTVATVLLPVADPARATEGGRALQTAQGVSGVSAGGGSPVTLRVGSGTYHFVCPLDLNRPASANAARNTSSSSVPNAAPKG